MNITALAIKNKALVLSFLIIILFGGATVFNEMPRDDMPPFLIRYATIVSNFSGAAPERMEMLVTDKIEEVIQEIPQVDYVSSESRTGISIVTVSIKDSESDLRPIFDNIRRKVTDIQDQLPAGVVPTVDDEVGDVFGIIVGITAPDFTYAEIKAIADEVRDELIKLPNAAKVEISGDQPERIFIEYDEPRLAELRLTKEKLQAVLAAQNIIFPGGDITIGSERIILEPSGNYESVEEIGNTLITRDQNRSFVYLRDVAHIYRGYVDPPSSIVKINGIKGLALGVSLKAGGNIISLGKDVDSKLDLFREQYPIGVDFLRVADQDRVVDLSVKDFIGNLIQSVVVVMIVMFLFLGVRTGLVVAMLIPSTIVMTLLLMATTGTGLNRVTLASLIIALGMLVDNAIVISESILVKMQAGEGAVTAAVQSSRELMVPLLISTLTTSAAFVSFYLAESVMGEIMGNIFVVVSIALLCSWLLALTIVPLMAVLLLKVKTAKKSQKGKKTLFERLQQGYGWALVFNLKHPLYLLVAVAVLFWASLQAAGWLPFVFFPDSDRALVTANLELPIGTSIERTETVVAEIERFVEKNLQPTQQRPEGVTSWSAYIGKGAPKYDLGYNPPEANSYSAHVLLNTSAEGINEWVIDQLDAFCFDKFPDLTATISRLKSGGGSADPVAVRIYGKDQEKLDRIVVGVKQKMASIAGTRNVKDDWGLRTKKIVIDVDQSSAQLAGVTSQDIATSLQTVLTGAQIGAFREGDQSIPILMRSTQASDRQVSQLESLNVFSQQSGQSVPLKQVANSTVVWEASKILRRDLSRTMTVTSDLKTGTTAAEVVAELRPWLQKQSADWGAGYHWELGGEAEDTSKNIGAVFKYLPVSFVIILLLLIGQFNSIRKPIIVLLTIPLGLIGVIFGLLAAGSYMSFMAFLGIISLAGIVINNGIVLLDRIKMEIEVFQRSESEAIVAAAQQRFRPILLTTATTSLGLIPLWMGGGIMWEPMAIGIIFGLLFATVITLLFVPVVYKLFFRVRMETQ